MRRLAAVGLVLAVACCAGAGGNPNVRAYIDFDPPNYVHDVTPAPYTTVDAYLCLDQLDSGMTVVSFRLTDVVAEFPGVLATQAFMSLLPGDIPIGGWRPWEPQGAVVGSTICAGTDGQPLAVGYATYFYLGGPAWLEILDHPDWPRWVVDCSDPLGEHDQYCVFRNGSIGGAEVPLGDCEETPVECGRWGVIKSLYR